MENITLAKLKKYEGTYFDKTHSGAGKWLQYKLLSVKEGEIEASITVRKDMSNPNGMLHGGMISMISDELIGLAFYSMGKQHYYTTVNLIVDYLYGAPVGSTVIAKAKVLRSGKSIANVECYIYDAEGRIISHATSNLVNTQKQVFEVEIT